MNRSGRLQGSGAGQGLSVLASWSPDVQAAMVVLARRGRRGPNEANRDNDGDGIEVLQLANVDLRRAQLPEARMRGAVLRDSNLARAILAKADLCDVDFARSNLEGVDLRDAELQGARLRRVNLRHADLGGAKLENADLEYADLRHAILNGARLQAARATADTLWPEGFDPNEHGVEVRPRDRWR
jgi:uncharacterized protein YjbI with pentapeptide repeats